MVKAKYTHTHTNTNIQHNQGTIQNDVHKRNKKKTENLAELIDKIAV